MTEQPWILAIDFGTSFTVAAVKVDGRNAEVVEIAGERRMPSIVMIEDDGNLVVGRVAEHLAATNPARTLRAPKSRLGDQAPVVLAGRPHQIADLVAGLLRFVYAEVTRQMGGTPREVRLTHPAAWNRPRLNRLLEAAAKAGLERVSLVPEPVGAALFYANEIGVEAGSQVAVYDLGGGTFDSAVVTATGSGFSIIGRPGGDQTIGGELFDEILFNHVGEQLPADAWYEIQVGEEPDWQQAGAALRNEVRRAKESLSSHPYAGLLVPLPDGLEQVRVTVDEYERLIGPYIDETVTLLARTIENAGLKTEDLEAVYLVGGASRAPIVERAVRARYPGVTVSRRGDPKTSVVLGAATAVQLNPAAPVPTDRSTQDAAPATSPQPLLLGPPPGVTPPPGPPSSPTGLSSGPPTPTPAPTATPSYPPQAPGAPTAPTPTTAAHTATPPSSPPQPIGAATVAGLTGSPSVAPAPPQGPGGSGSGSGTSSRTQWMIIGGIAAAVLLLVAGFLIFGGGDDGSSASDRTDESDDTRDDTRPRATLIPPIVTIAPGTTPDSGVPPTVTLPSTVAPGTTDPGTSGTAPANRTVEELQAGLLTSEEVNAKFLNEFVQIDVSPSTEQFCGIVPPVMPVVQAIHGFSNAQGTAELYSTIDRYASEADAITMLEQDKAFTDTCPQFTQTIGGVEYSVLLAPFGDVVEATLEGEFAAVIVSGFTTGTGGESFNGFIIEKRDGANIVAITGYRYNAAFDDAGIENFLSLMVSAFAKAEAVR